jgi:hypothetical protein
MSIDRDTGLQIQCNVVCETTWHGMNGTYCANQLGRYGMKEMYPLVTTVEETVLSPKPHCLASSSLLCFLQQGKWLAKLLCELKLYESQDNKQRCSTLHPSSDAALGRVWVELVPTSAEKSEHAFMHVCGSLQRQGVEINHLLEAVYRNELETGSP